MVDNAYRVLQSDNAPTLGSGRRGVGRPHDSSYTELRRNREGRALH
jgi:hypothetical protein